MKIRVEWQAPLLVAKHKKLLDWEAGMANIERRAGVYFFSRQHGDKRIPFYIGESADVRKRFKQHMGTTKIVDVLRSLDDGGSKEIRQGARHFHFGYLIPAQGQKSEACRKIVQRFMIEKAMAEGHPILNKQLTTIPTHELAFVGSSEARGIYEKKAEPKR